MKTTSLSFVENKESRVSSVNQEVIDTTSVAVRNYKVGNIYRFANHTFAVWAKGSWKNETTGKVSNHVVFAVTFDGGSQEQYLDSEGIKQKIGDERRAVRATSMDSNGKATKVKRTSEETAMLVENKYDKAIAAIEAIITKLGCDNDVANLKQDLLCALIKEKFAKVDILRNEAKRVYLANKARRDEAKQEFEANLAKIDKAYQAHDFKLLGTLSTTNDTLQAEIALLDQKVAAYEAEQIVAEANNENASEETEETTAEETVSEQPAE